jgi:hypothetical protein
MSGKREGIRVDLEKMCRRSSDIFETIAQKEKEMTIFCYYTNGDLSLSKEALFPLRS